MKAIDPSRRSQCTMVDRWAFFVTSSALASCIGIGGAFPEADDPQTHAPSDPVVPYAPPESATDASSQAPRVTPMLVAGGFHACVRREDGRAACWGLGEYGQLGNGALADRTRPVEVIDLDDIAELALGLEHSCARLQGGEVRCWGANAYGQLGDGTDTHRNTPVAVLDIDDAIDIAVDDHESCAMRSDGSVACWGGSLGGMPISLQPDTGWRATPRIEYGGARKRGLAITRRYRCLWADAGVECWGYAAFDACNTGGEGDASRCPMAELIGVVDMDLDYSFGCAVIDDGTVKCWGGNGYGQTPSGAGQCSLDYPEPGCPRTLLGVDDAIQIAVGTWHACALDKHRRVTCWGANNFGQLGTALARDEAARWRDIQPPTAVERWRGVVEIAAGRGFTCARMHDDEIDCIGDMAEGRRPRVVAW